MKTAVLVLALIIFSSAIWGQDSSYRQLQVLTRELVIKDSLQLDKLSNGYKLDTANMKRFFAPLISSGNNPFKNRFYTCLGRICDHENFDIFIVMEERRRADSSGMNSTYMVTLKKTGEYISSQKVAVSGTKKRSGYNIRSTLYRDNRVFIDSKIVTGEKVFEEAENYQISKTGRFLMAEKDN